MASTVREVRFAHASCGFGSSRAQTEMKGIIGPIYSSGLKTFRTTSETCSNNGLGFSDTCAKDMLHIWERLSCIPTVLSGVRSSRQGKNANMDFYELEKPVPKRNLWTSQISSRARRELFVEKPRSYCRFTNPAQTNTSEIPLLISS